MQILKTVLFNLHWAIIGCSKADIRNLSIRRKSNLGLQAHIDYPHEQSLKVLYRP